MKTRIAMAMMAIGVSSVVLAQESDDMYFNSKDRAKLSSINGMILARQYQQEDMTAVKTNPVNPSDSYSGRGINPEFNSQAKNGTTVVQNNPDYFLAGYAPKNVNSSLYSGNASNYSNCNCNNMYGMNNSMYSPYSSMYSPYGMGSMYSPYAMYSPYSMYSPYGMGSMYGMGMSMSSMYGMGGYGMYGMGMSSMYGMSGFGMSYTMGWGMPGYGMGSMMYNPYSSYYYGSAYGYGYASGSEGRAVVNGTHPSRSSSLNNTYANQNRNSVGTVGGVNSTASRSTSGGRMEGGQTNYYDRSWRNNSSNFTTSGNSNGSPARSGWGNNSGTSGWNNGSNDGWGGRNSGGSWGNNNSGSSFGGGGTRSSGFSGGGFSGGGGGGSGTSHSRGH